MNDAWATRQTEHTLKIKHDFCWNAFISSLCALASEPLLWTIMEIAATKMWSWEAEWKSETFFFLPPSPRKKQNKISLKKRKNMLN